MATYATYNFEFEGQQLLIWTRYDEITAITSVKMLDTNDSYNYTNFARAEIPPEKYDALREAIEFSGSIDWRRATFYGDPDMNIILQKKQRRR